MQSGIKPAEANERLSIFQSRFDELWKRYITFSAGEEIFGLSKTEYVDLARIKKELSLLSKLYGLYDDVVKGVNGYYDIKWVDVDVESLNNQLMDFSTRTKKLPKALKDWGA
jgi:dynein heavy chain